MADISFKEVIIGADPIEDSGLVDLINRELGGSRSLSAIMMELDYNFGSTKILGGFVAGELSCISAFTKLQFLCDGASVIGYQCGFSATSGRQRGKGYWPQLLKFAEDYLADLGAAFIFAFPNPVSHPLFVKKLNYISMDMCNFRIAKTPIWPLPYLQRPHYTTKISAKPSALRPNYVSNVAWKQRCLTKGTIAMRAADESFIWGKIRTTTKLGIKLRFLDLGGFELERPEILSELLGAIMESVGVRLCHLSMNRENEYFDLLNVTESAYSPLIIKSLDKLFVPTAHKLNFFRGLADTY